MSEIYEISKDNLAIAKLANIPTSISFYKLKSPILFSLIEMEKNPIEKQFLISKVDEFISTLDDVLSFSFPDENDPDLKPYLDEISSFLKHLKEKRSKL